jgi:hypothetical protein
VGSDSICVFFWDYNGAGTCGSDIIHANEHRLLRGECRYTIARVYEHGYSTRHRYARLEFWVHGGRYRHDENIDNDKLLPVGSCWFLRYAVPDPDANEFMGISMPDSVRVVPLGGWAKLPLPVVPPAPVAPPAPEVPPSPAGPPAPVIPAAAPEPLTGPAASPVFRAPMARVDTVVRLFAAPAPLVPEHLPH